METLSSKKRTYGRNSFTPTHVNWTLKEMARGFFSDFICPLCTKEYDKLYHTICRHKICERCKSDLFKAKQEQTINCPFCSRALRKRDVSEKSQEELYYENEIRERNLLLLEFSESRENFESDEEYHSFLEYFEDVVQEKLKSNKIEENKTYTQMVKEYRKRKAMRHKRKEWKEKKIAMEGMTNLISLDKIEYPKMVNTRNDKGKKKNMKIEYIYQASGYHLKEAKNKDMNMYKMFLNTLSS